MVHAAHCFQSEFFLSSLSHVSLSIIKNTEFFRLKKKKHFKIKKIISPSKILVPIHKA